MPVRLCKKRRCPGADVAKYGWKTSVLHPMVNGQPVTPSLGSSGGFSKNIYHSERVGFWTELS